jgi:S-adenosyl-L-methionine hydrolase (adenosine-forming)
MAARRNRRGLSVPLPHAPGSAPVITLTSDFGIRDPFVAIMKGVILRAAPHAQIVDVTHEVPAQNVVAGAYALRGAAPWFPRRTIHVAVVDPGVGTRRRALVVETADAYFVGPDNGLLSLAVPARESLRIFDVSRSRVRLRPVSRTFHGRDVFAPVAAALAAGAAPETLGSTVRSMQRLRPPAIRRRGTKIFGEVLWVDHFGNLTTNVTRTDLDDARFRGRRLSTTIGAHVVPIRASYASVPRDSPLALMNSSGFLEIAVNQGSAAANFAAGAGTRLRVEVA